MGGTARILGETTRISVEHVVVASKRPYQQVIDALEARLGPVVNWDAILDQLMDAKVSWEQFTQECEVHIGPSGLTLFYKVRQPLPLSVRKKQPGNPIYHRQSGPCLVYDEAYARSGPVCSIQTRCVPGRRGQNLCGL